MEVEMKLGDSWYLGESLDVCAKKLQKEIDLPKGNSKIFAVFTKKRTPDTFRIQPPDTHGRSVIVGIDEYIMSYTRKQLGRAYKGGFRYVHIEY